MESFFMKDVKGEKLYKEAEGLIAKGNHIKALEIFEDLLSVHWKANDSWLLHLDQGNLFLELAQKAEDPDMEIAYLLGCIACFSQHVKASELCAQSLYFLAKKLGSVLYYKQCVVKGKEGLSENNPDKLSSVAPVKLRALVNQKKKELESLINDAELKIAASKTSPLKPEPEVRESKKSTEPSEYEFKELRSYWVGLDVKIKREFMQVNIAKLASFVEGVHKRKGRDALKQVLASAREDRKWTFWMCRALCSKKFSSAEECKNHLEQQHAADFKLPSEKDMVKRIGKDWARKISVGSWEPVDAVAAAEMIKNQLADVKAFASKNGWSKEWPLAADEERSKLLKEIKLLLVSFCDRKILSGSIRDWMMRFPVNHLVKLEVSEQSLVDSRLVETPQSICFLESHELNQILDFLSNIKCERNDGTGLVCRAVDSLLGCTRVKEKIDFDPQFSYLLLDKRLLNSNTAPFDDEGAISVFDPNVHYAKAYAQGDDIISWLTDYNSVDKTFPRPIREHNFGIWVAVLKAVQFTCRTLGTRYAKKVQVLDYGAALTIVENMCMYEDERRRTLPEDQWSIYASLLCDGCEEIVPENSLPTKLFLCAVRDVLEGASHPTFDFPDLEDCLNLIRERKSLSDNKVLKSIGLLRSVVTHKVLLMDSKILLIDNSRISLLNNLTRLSAFDNRTYILQLLKPFLLNEIVNMESKVKSDAAEADLLVEVEKKKPQSKKKNNRSKKKTPTSMSSPLDKTVEHKPSINLEPESTSASLRTVEEDCTEPEDALASEMGRLEISSRTEIQEEATNDDPDMHNMPGEEDSQSADLESAPERAAARYNSALDMTLKNEIVNMESKAKSDAAEADPLIEVEKKKKTQSKKKPQSKKKNNKSKKKTPTSMSSPLDKTVEHKPSINLEPESTSASLRTVEEDCTEPEDALASEMGRLEILSRTEIQEEATKDDPDMHNMPAEEDSQSAHLESAPERAEARYNSALDMTLKALLNIKVLKEDLMNQPLQGHLEEQVPSALQNLFTAFVSEVIKNEGVYSCLLSDLLASQEEVLPMSSDAAKVVVAILEFWRCWKNPESESLVTRLFMVPDNKRMSCRKCRRITNYPEQSYYGIVMPADSIRELKCAFGNIKFVDILKVIRMGYKMLCDSKTGGCGKTNYVHHVISRCPPIFTIVLKWEKSATENEISETTKALDWEIDISRLYEEGLEPNTNYRLVSMVGYSEVEEHICLVYEKNRWVNLRRECLAGEDVGDWKNVVRFCGERKVRPEILFYEAA